MDRRTALACLAIVLFAPLASFAEPTFVRRVTLPLVLSLDGAEGARWTTELVLVNAGATPVDLSVRYTAVVGGGSGEGSDHLAPFEQRVLPDAIGWLREVGLDLPDGGPHSGTLTVVFRGSSNPNLTTMSARITTPSGPGRAGLAMSAFDYGWEDRAWIPGLHEDAARRSNLALLHFGNPGDGDLVLAVRLFAGDGSAPVTFEETLHAGEFRQIDRVLARGGMTSGFVEIERIAGASQFLTYVTVIDRETNDPALVLPQIPSPKQLLPEAVDSSAWRTEVVLANPSGAPVTAHLTWTSGSELVLPLAPWQQVLIPDLGAAVRLPGSPDVMRGPVVVRTDSGWSAVVLSALVVSRGAGGRFGVGIDAHYPNSVESTDRIFGVAQDETRRSSLVIGSWDPDGNRPQLELHVEVWDGDAQRRAGETFVSMPAGSSYLIPSVLTSLAPGVRNAWITVTQTSPSYPRPFFALSVLNDGPAPGAGTGDGQILSAQEERGFSPPQYAPPPVLISWAGGHVWEAFRSDDLWLVRKKPSDPSDQGLTALPNPSASPRTGLAYAFGYEFPVLQHGNATTPYDGIYTGAVPQGTFEAVIQKGDLVHLRMPWESTAPPPPWAPNCQTSGLVDVAFPAGSPVEPGRAFRFSLPGSPSEIYATLDGAGNLTGSVFVAACSFNAHYFGPTIPFTARRTP